jgi:hypothetical protein
MFQHFVLYFGIKTQIPTSKGQEGQTPEPFTFHDPFDFKPRL